GLASAEVVRCGTATVGGIRASSQRCRNVRTAGGTRVAERVTKKSTTGPYFSRYGCELRPMVPIRPLRRHHHAHSTYPKPCNASELRSIQVHEQRYSSEGCDSEPCCEG